MTHHNSRKSHRVYRSPSSSNEPSPYAKSSKETTMEIDAKDEEAGTILMALSQHATRMRSNSMNNDRNATATASATTARSNSMSIRNLLVDNETSSSAEIPSSRQVTNHIMNRDGKDSKFVLRREVRYQQMKTCTIIAINKDRSADILSTTTIITTAPGIIQF
ncbi:hypothetical protein HMPREF1544_03483 [Mucor circinelloides 1006PhL]|uniref:Uncharacterized protein n=1 Tax=Mucor circinelloides f. circinelloides (strain 1006PhL) TaxID=1220926 RepID=S2JIF4_MUCC1|nr:hypothetical protein HMPREF1544_03483 [Mucor circinelloides 1006PhL]